MTFPRLIKKGIVRVYKVRNRVYRKRIYHSFELRYFNRSARLVREKKSTLKLALKRGEEIAADILSGAPVVDMSAADRDRWKTAVQNLYPTGVSTDQATLEYAQARAILGEEISLVDCARAWRKVHPAGQVRLTVAAAVEEFLKHKKLRGIGERQMQSLRSRLNTFAGAFGCELAFVTPPLVDRWLSGLKVKNRTRNNYLGDVQNFFNWARRVRGVTATDLGALQKGIVRPSSNQLWRPSEMRLLLESARVPYPDKRGRGGRPMLTDDRLIPFLAVGAFAKVRSAELLRLDWSQVRWAEGVIVIRSKDAKTNTARKIVMPENLKAWLKPFARASGRLVLLGESGLHRRLRTLARRAGLTWRRNALRNSASTYHAIASNDVKLVSREAGNSPAILEAEYLNIEGATAADAKAWFEIFPDHSGAVSQILHLPLFA